MKQVIEANYKQIKADVMKIVENEMERIKNDPDLQHLPRVHLTQTHNMKTFGSVEYILSKRK